MSAEPTEPQTPATPADPPPPRTPWPVAIGVGLGVSVLIGLVAAAFLWPLTTAQPQHISLAVAGPDQAVTAIEKQLDAKDADLFDVSRVDDRDAAVDAIRTREAAGAIVVGQKTEVLSASAGNPQIAQMLTQVGDAIRAQQAKAAMHRSGQDQPGAPDQTGNSSKPAAPNDAGGAHPPQVTITDVVPAGKNGMATNLTMMPVLIGGIAGAIVSLSVVRTPVRRFATLGTIAVGGGLIGSAVLGPWFDILHGGFWVDAAAITMGIVAIGSFIVGLGTLFGPVGQAVGPLLFFLIGMPWGGLFAPREFLSEPMGTVGALMPNGTLVDLLRSLSFFPDAPTGMHWLVLAVWASVGLALLALGSLLHHRKHAHHYRH